MLVEDNNMPNTGCENQPSSPCEQRSHPAVCYTDHDPQLRYAVGQLCQTHGWKFHALSSVDFSRLGCELCDPGCVVVDLDDAGVDCDKLIEQFGQAQIFVPVVVVASENNISKAIRFMRAGAVSFLGKPVPSSALEEAIVTAMRAEEHQRELRGIYREAVAQLSQLTHAQRRVLELLMEGESNKSISTKLNIGLRTAERDRAQVMAALDASSLAEVARKVVITELQPVGLKRMPFAL